MPSSVKSVLIALLVGIALIIFSPLTADAFSPLTAFVAPISSYSHAADFALATMAVIPAAARVEVGGYTVPEFASLFRISRGLVYKLHLEGKLKFTKIGARTVILPSEARRFQRALEADSA